MRPSMMEQLHIFFLNLTQTVVTAHKENAKTVTDGLVAVPSARPGDARDCSQEQLMLFNEWMFFRQAHNPLVHMYIMEPVNRRSDHARGNKYPCATGPERAWAVNASLPLRPDPLLESVPSFLQC